MSKLQIGKYVGKVDLISVNDLFIGLELEQRDSMGHSGIIQNKQYFEAKEGYGCFVKLEDLIF